MFKKNWRETDYDFKIVYLIYRGGQKYTAPQNLEWNAFEKKVQTTKMNLCYDNVNNLMTENSDSQWRIYLCPE